MPAREGVEDKAAAMGTVAMSKEQRAKSKILILHGWGYSTDKWAPCLKLLESHGSRPELLKIPGLTAPIDRPWTLKDYVKWLKEKTGNEKVILIGHSNGGRISIAFTLKYPEKVSRLILIDSGGIQHIQHNEWYTRLKRFIFMFLSKVGKKIVNHNLARDLIYKLAGVSDYKEAGPLMRETMINLISIDLKPELKKITVPTLIIWGAKDKITPLSDGKLMNKLIPNSKLYVVGQTRHSPQFTHPEEVCAKITEALNGRI